MRRRVLVEQRVVEDETGLADARVTVDESDLSESRGAVVGRHVRAHHVLARLRPDLDGATVLETHLEATHDVALDLQGERRADDAVDAPCVGCREHLLGRHVRDVLDAG